MASIHELGEWAVKAASPPICPLYSSTSAISYSHTFLFRLNLPLWMEERGVIWRTAAANSNCQTCFVWLLSNELLILWQRLCYTVDVKTCETVRTKWRPLHFWTLHWHVLVTHWSHSNIKVAAVQQSRWISVTERLSAILFFFDSD